MIAILRLLLISATLSLTAGARIIHVDRAHSEGAQNGRSWQDAYQHLQDALAVAERDDEIWVAAGVYYPDEGAGQSDNHRRSTFQLPQHVSCYGGFSGTEEERRERDPQQHLTILSGDLRQDDDNADGNHVAESDGDLRGSNADHVVTCQDPRTLLSGFTITAGHGNRSGAGLTISGRGLAQITRCRFIGNRSSSDGGALSISGGTHQVINCLFANNTAGEDGGAVSLSSPSTGSSLVSCLFVGNRARYGGALSFSGSNSTWVHNTTITGNHAVTGGALNVATVARPRFLNCIIWANTISNPSPTASPTIRNLVPHGPTFGFSLVEDSTGRIPGPLGNAFGPLLDHPPAFLRPYAAERPIDPKDYQIRLGSPVLNSGSGETFPRDAVDLDDDGDTTEPLPFDFLGANRQQGTIEMGALEVTGPSLRQDPSPLLFRPGNGEVRNAFNLSDLFEESALTFAHVSTSPSTVEVEVDAATGAVHLRPLNAIGRTIVVVSASDEEGQTSYLSLTVDVFPTVVYVDEDSPDGGSGLSWESALNTLQDALGLGGRYYDLWIAEGTYTPDRGTGLTVDDPSLSFELNGIRLYGGFAGHELNPAERVRGQHPTILSGNLRSGRSKTVVTASAAVDQPEIVLDGLTITGGSGGRGAGVLLQSGKLALRHCQLHTNRGGRGSALYLSSEAEATLSDCSLHNNKASWKDSAIHCSSESSLFLTRCTLTENEGTGIGTTEATVSLSDCELARNNGLCLSLQDSELRIEDCSFRDNSAATGTLTLNDCTGIVRDCQFAGNHAIASREGGGAALHLTDSAPTFVRCDFLQNRATALGGAVWTLRCSTAFLNCRFLRNEAEMGGAFYHQLSSNQFLNCLFVGNRAVRGGALYSLGDGGNFLHSTFHQNEGIDRGGAFYLREGTGPILRNCLLWKNSSNGTIDAPRATIATEGPIRSAQFQHCLVGGSGGSANWNTALRGENLGNNLDADPSFVIEFDPLNRTAPFDLRLSGYSPALDAGSRGHLLADEFDLDGDDDRDENLPVDLANQPRLQGDSVDVGAREHSPGPFLDRVPTTLQLAPLSGAHRNVVDLRELTDRNDLRFSLEGISVPTLVEAEVDEHGQLSVAVLPNQFGRTYLTLQVHDPEDNHSFFTLQIDVVPAILYVATSAEGAGSGLTWKDAFPTLQEALEAPRLADHPYTIWMAKGTYLPVDGPMELSGNLTILGGFRGDEQSAEERDPTSHLTILSGDLDQNDLGQAGITSPEGQQGSNAPRILSLTDPTVETVLDGLIFTGATEQAIFHEGATLHLQQCRFHGNKGRALWTSHSTLTLDRCRFSHNEGAIEGQAAGVSIDHCTFNHLHSPDSGSAIALQSLSAPAKPTELVCRNTTFTQNSSGQPGGAVFVASGQAQFIGCIFEENRVNGHGPGGALHSSRSGLELIECQFFKNASLRGDGGAVFASGDDVLLINCVIQGNSANSGGGVNIETGAGSLINCLIAGNRAYSQGGGIYRRGLGQFVVTNCTVTGNFSHDRDAGISGGSIQMQNSILWNNQEGHGRERAAEASWTNTFAHSVVATSGGSANWNRQSTDLGGNLDLDPRFLHPIDPTLAPTAAGDFRLRADSPARDAGSSQLLPPDLTDLDQDDNTAERLPLDLALQPRRQNTVGLGAYEAGDGPTALQEIPVITMRPESGTHPAALDLSSFIDETATRYTIVSASPSDLIEATLAPDSGVLALTSDHDRIGCVRLLVEVGDQEENTSLVAISIQVKPPVVYVDRDAKGTASGTSWDNAFPRLQDALQLGLTDFEVWVARGVYYPDDGPGQANDDRSATFRLPRGVKLFGGFRGREQNRSRRDPASRLTILSGDLAQDDLNNDRNRISESPDDLVGANAFTVVTANRTDEDTIFDGFIVTGGLGEHERPLDYRTDGAGLLLTRGALTISQCTFIGNESSQYGGGLMAHSATSSLIRDCRFLSNKSQNGAGVASWGSSLQITNSQFHRNQARHGGGLMVHAGSHHTLTHCQFRANTGEGGGLNWSTASEGTITGCVFSGNLAGRAGALLSRAGELQIINSLFTGNQTNGGSALVQSGDAHISVANSIVWNNRNGLRTDDPAASSEGNIRYHHSLIANSGGSADWNSEVGIDGGNNLDADPQFILPANPALAPTTVGDFRLQIISPALETGRTGLLPNDEFDLDDDGDLEESHSRDLGNGDRISGTTVDMGPYEANANAPRVVRLIEPRTYRPNSGLHSRVLNLSHFFDESASHYSILATHPPSLLAASTNPRHGRFNVLVKPDQFGEGIITVKVADDEWNNAYYNIRISVVPRVVHVDPRAQGSGSGLSWENAIPSLQEILLREGTGYEVWIANGVYYPDEGPAHVDGDRMATFNLRDGVKYFGGFAGHETVLEERSGGPTILSGDIHQLVPNDDGDFIVNRPPSAALQMSYTVVSGRDLGFETSLDRFTITGGKNSGGAGMHLTNSSPNLSNLRFIGNATSSSFEEGGAALLLSHSSPNISLCRFEHNESRLNVGGAIACTNNSVPLIRNTLFAHNRAVRGGALSLTRSSAVDLVNCTLANNMADSGGAILNEGWLQTFNTIIWNNEALEAPDHPSEHSIAMGDESTNLFSHSLIAHSGGSDNWHAPLGQDQGGNLDQDPLFYQPPGEGAVTTHFLDEGSPAMDRGTMTKLTLFDLSGRVRVNGGRIDLGAFEAHGDERDSDDDGLSDAFERQHSVDRSATGLAADGDPDRDGLNNLLEFALDLDPLQADAQQLQPVPYLDRPERLYLALPHRRSLWAQKYLTIEVERSVDMGASSPWSTEGLTTERQHRLDDFTEELLPRSRSLWSQHPSEFLRLRVDRR